ncbi:MAG: aminotransferase class III-fold pyridoxal phosphate-dependent enzyme [Spirochaetes bacterium]|nr:aminotransferase class III-fold pyridoxal phosphate-dependent enzyme [Spirochaetota bacterium]
MMNEKNNNPNLAPSNYVFYRNQKWNYPKITHGSGIYIFDEDGKTYIDGCSGSAVANIGHGNKEIAHYAKEHIEKIAFTHLSRWTMDSIEKCAEKVAAWTPGDLNHVYFVSGGSEASETAIKMVRQYFVERDGKSTSKWKIISKWNSFHGNTLGSLAMTGITGRKKMFDPLLLNFPKIPQFYHYRNPWRADSLEDTSIRAAEALEDEILRWGPENIAGFISEPVVGSAAPGVHPTPTYFKICREICDKYDVLMIIDEVMTGFGRTGKNFGIDHYDIVPDIIITGKGMSAGYTPMGTTIANEKIFNTIMINGSGQFVHGHTFAGNPLSCGISSKVIEILEREECTKNAEIQGDYLLEKLKELHDLPIIGDIRGKGLLCGIEFVQDKITRKPFPAELKVSMKVTCNALKEGLVVYPGTGSVNGILGDHILIAPPLTINHEEMSSLIEKLTKALDKTCSQIKNYI